MNILQKASQELGCQFRNKNSLDLEPVSRQQVTDWLVRNGFQRSRIRHGKWVKGTIELIFDTSGGFLYFPRL